MRRGPALVVAAAAVLVGAGATAGTTRAQEDPPATTVPAPASTDPGVPADEGGDGPAPVGTSPVVVVPAGCARPAPPAVVFTGRLVDRDFRTGRFRVETVRAGDPAPYAVGNLIDVRYGNDVRALELGEAYVVAAGIHPDLGVLFSQIREPAPPFGGDDVISVQESDVPCPVLEDPIRTLEPDGTSVESGVLTPLFEDRAGLLGAVVVPLAVAVAAVFALAAVRLLLDGVVRGVRTLGRQRR